MTIAVLTGAGMSTESGIPDYRGPHGLWKQDPDYEKLVTYRHYVTDPEIRRRSWLFREASPVWDAAPNAAHHALAARPEIRIITQNVDRLHQRAGSPGDRVLELHGNVFDAVCIDCSSRTSTREMLRRLHAGEDDPSCSACGGIVKTDTVMFGQMLDPDLLERAVSAARGADVFVAIGTSLQVHPAAGLLDVAADAGARIVIVNAEPTPYDHLAAEVIRDPVSVAVPDLLSRL